MELNKILNQSTSHDLRRKSNKSLSLA